MRCVRRTRHSPISILLLIYSTYAFVLVIKTISNFSLRRNGALPIDGADAVYGNTVHDLSRKRLGIIEVLTAKTSPEMYETALSSVACYARIHNYDFHVVNDAKYVLLCPQRDKFFRRHCIIEIVLKDYDYVLFLDSDIGVVYPERRIEEYFDPYADIIFYDRFYNSEVMSGSYLVRNSKWSHSFLQGFANFEFRLPNSVHGSDNGALHVYLAELLTSGNDTILPVCKWIYENSRGYGDLYLFEVCYREVLGYGSSFGKIKILRKGTGWVRDPRMTNSKWSKDHDFMIHNWKTATQKSYRTVPVPLKAVSKGERWYDWYNPFLGKFELNLCSPSNKSWNFDENLLESLSTIQDRLAEYGRDVERMKRKFLSKLKQLSQFRNWTDKMDINEVFPHVNQSWYEYVV